MNIILICCNFGKISDGIGDYCGKVYKRLIKLGHTVTVFSREENIYRFRVRQVLALKMLSAFEDAEEYLKLHRPDIIVTEYPFMDCNPLVVGFFRRLVKKGKKLNIPVCASIHEYSRTNWFRKKITLKIAKYSSFLFVTDADTKNKLASVEKTFIRMIPSSVDGSEDNSLRQKKKNMFCFFGLASKAKAFPEMISAWKSFHLSNPDCSLKIITSSKLDKIPTPGIELFIGCDSSAVRDLLKDCTFCINPTKPFIGENNGTIKTMLLNNVITIGKFDPSSHLFNSSSISIDNLDSKSILSGLTKAYKTPYPEIKKLMSDGELIGKHYSVENAAIVYETILDSCVRIFKK